MSAAADAEPEVQDGARVSRRTYAPYVGRPEMAALARGRDLTELDITQQAYGEMASALARAGGDVGPTVPPEAIRYRVQFELIKDFGDGPTVSFDAVTALANEAILPPRRKARSAANRPRPRPAWSWRARRLAFYATTCTPVSAPSTRRSPASG